MVAYILEVHDPQTDVIELILLDPTASKQGHLYTPSIVKFPYIFNYAKEMGLSPHLVKRHYPNTAVLVHTFTILCVGIVRVPIDVISIPRCHLSRWTLCQLTDGNRVCGFLQAVCFGPSTMYLVIACAVS